jgi:hypothetical protein
MNELLMIPDADNISVSELSNLLSDYSGLRISPYSLISEGTEILGERFVAVWKEIVGFHEIMHNYIRDYNAA